MIRFVNRSSPSSFLCWQCVGIYHSILSYRVFFFDLCVFVAKKFESVCVFVFCFDFFWRYVYEIYVIILSF